MSLDIVLHDTSDTTAFASRLAALLAPGDVVILNGELAAGKTFLVQATARALGSDNYISSPTYTIAHFYNYPQGRILHIDAYRLNSQAEFRDLVLDEFFEEVIAFIEWGDRIVADFDDYLTLNIAFGTEGDQQRHIHISATGTRATAVLSLLSNDLATTPL